MKRIVLLCSVLFVVSTPPMRSEPVSREAILKQYCLQCHNAKVKSGSLTLEGVTTDNPAGHADVWEKVVRKLQAGEMPPPKMPRPDADTVRDFTSGLVSDLDAAARRKPYAGKPLIRRLNRTEYANAVRDLLAIELPVAAELPE